MSNPYFDLEDLLSGFETLPVTSIRQLVGVGGLDPRATDNVLAKGAEVQAPIWLLEFVHSRRCFSHKVPPELDEKQRQTLDIEPKSFRVDFKFSGNHFLTLYRMCRLFAVEKGRRITDVEPALRKAMAARGLSIDRESATLCPAEKKVIRDRRTALEVFDYFRTCILQ